MTKLPIHRSAKPMITDKISRGLANLPEVVLVRPWRGYPVGYVIRPPGVLRQVLIQQGIGKLASDLDEVDEKPDTEPAEVKKTRKRKATVED